jgi:hypothetical protein
MLSKNQNNLDIKKKDKLIEEINIRGPWVHGYFDLGNGIIIQDKDELQRKRLFALKNAFNVILKKIYKRRT